MTKLFVSRGFFPEQYFRSTADYIRSVQQADGCIPWFDGGHADPWDHIESAMGLSIAGYYDEAEAAYDWLRQIQLPDGNWMAAYKDGEIHDGTRSETNFVAYIATGVWHHYLIRKDRDFLARMWFTVKAAMDFVLDLQSEVGEIYWTVDTTKGVREDALVTGCSSIYKSLECAVLIAAELGFDRPDWQQARWKLGHALRNHPERFDRTWESKERFSMDWFYPVMTGVVRGNAARQRLQSRWNTFVKTDRGCLCVSDEPWVTVAESAELTMSLIAAGEYQKAARLFSWLHDFREKDGSYWTGYTEKIEDFWPEERPAWTAGAVLLAADALTQFTAASHLFNTVSLGDAPPRAEDGSMQPGIMR